MSLTSCEGALDDVFGEWSRPTPGNNTPSGGGDGGSSTINATALTLKQTMKVIKMGGANFTITTEVTPSDATVTWESADPDIATVENGVVTPVGKGITTITAKSGDLKATCEVFVGNVVDLSTIGADYNAADFDILTGTLSPSHEIKITDGYKVAFDGLTISYSIKCKGDATIYLTDGSTNTVTVVPASNAAGIWVGGAGTTLTINAETLGTGILEATGGSSGGAGIGTGGNLNYTGGNITINGGNITATGGSGGGAGIGTGKSNNAYTNKCGNITINSGKITANGGNDGSAGGAGIGTGYTDADYTGTTKNECGDITINGGTVIAMGGYSSVGIGTGYAKKEPMGTAADQKCGDITIGADVTSVTAKRGANAPRVIGVGVLDGSGATGNCGKIKFGTAEVFDGASPGTWDANIISYTNGDYGPFGGLKLTISETTNNNDTWTLTPSN